MRSFLISNESGAALLRIFLRDVYHERVVLLMVMEQSESRQIPRLRIDCTGWIFVGADDDRFGKEFGCTSTGGASHHLSFAGVQLETTAEHPVTDGVHTVRNPACPQRTYGFGVHVPERRSQVQPCTS